jgi:hypothetical protein
MQFIIFAFKAKVFMLRAFLLVAPVLYLVVSFTLALDCTILGEPYLGFHLSFIYIYIYY